MLIVLLAVILFMVMGMGVLMLNMSSTTKNVSRESNIQAQDLAMKGLDYVVKEIEKKIEDEAKRAGGLAPNEFNSKFTAILESYKCSFNMNRLQNTETGTATYCIKSYEDTDPIKTPLLKKVRFESIGQARDKEHVTEATFLLGSTVNLDFDYTLLTYGNQNPSVKVTKKVTTGNIELHGGSR